MSQIMPLNYAELVQTILAAYPATQAIYLFGSYATGAQHPGSDLDLAILLPPLLAKQAGSFAFGALHDQLTRFTKTDVDLINLRLVSTVFQHEIIRTGQRIYCVNAAACIEFEAMTLSFYQELNEKRRAIIEDIYASGRVYAP